MDNFDKLKQNDRIEYLLRLDRLEKVSKNRHQDWYYIFNFILVLVGFIILMFIGMISLVGIEKAAKLLSITVPIIRVGMIVILFSALWNLYNALKLIKDKKELNNEFFEIKPKKRGKHGR